ncbi:MAG: divalent-cation tolerance protein CutA [Gemmatimonadota bacterium]
MSSDGPDEVVVLTTAAGMEDATRLAEALVDRRLIACANLVPGVTSVYRWEGRVQRDSEVLLILKTTRAVVNRVEEELVDLHAYDVPEVLVLPVVGGSNDYLAWLRSEVEA